MDKLARKQCPLLELIILNVKKKKQVQRVKVCVVKRHIVNWLTQTLLCVSLCPEGPAAGAAHRAEPRRSPAWTED